MQKTKRRKPKCIAKESQQTEREEEKKGMEKNYRSNHKTNTKMAINTCLSIITLNVNGLNVPIDRYRVREEIKQQYPSICCLQETHFRHIDTCRLKARGWRNIYHANRRQKKAEVAILKMEKDFKTKTVKRDKEGHFIIIKGTILQDNRSIVSIYAPNMKALNT